MELTKIILLLTCLFCQSAFAGTILFLNFNRNGSAVASARRAAAARGDTLLVLPRRSSSRNGPALPENETLSEATFRAQIQTLSEEGVDLESIVFSGHDGGGGFFGHDGGLNSASVHKVIQDFPNIATSVKSLLLRGCYTATADQVSASSFWRQSFPNIHMIAGWEGAAPSSERETSKAYVEDILKLEDQLVRATNGRQIRNIYRTIGLYSQTRNAVWTRQCNGLEHYMTAHNAAYNRDAQSFEDPLSMCIGHQAEFDAKYAIVSKYFHATEAGYENPPSNTHAGELRAAYTWIRQYEHCMRPEIFGPNAEADFMSADIIIRLIYFKNVAGNYARHTDLTSMQAQLNNYNIPPSAPLTFPNFNTASRKTVNEFLSQFGERLNTYRKSDGFRDLSETERESFYELRSDYYSMNSSLHNLATWVVPFEWVEANSDVPSPNIGY